MFDAKVGIRRYKFKNDEHLNEAREVYNRVLENAAGDEYDIQEEFEEDMSNENLELIYAAQ